MILNLTQHIATPEQISQGVVDLPPDEREGLVALLTFTVEGDCGLAANASAAPDHVASRAAEIVARFVTPRIAAAAREMLHSGGYECGSDLSALAMLRPEVAAGDISAMIGGAPYLMAPLERALRRVGVRPVYALSERASEEQVQPDGGTKKVAVFRHAGFVEACGE